MNTDFYDKHLRSFPVPKPLLDHEDVPFFGSLPDLLRSLKKIFGLNIVFVRAGGTLPNIMARCFTVKVDGGKSPGCLALLPPDTSDECLMPAIQQNEFLNSLSLLLGDAYRWQQMFRKYEEELATLVPIPSLDPKEFRFTETLFDILKEGAKILDCQASSLYLLNTMNNTLKLRSCWGLPEERLLDPPRALQESLADLEAMLGQAVVLNEDYLQEAWPMPEEFPAAVCVPVTSPISIIGTLWFFADKRREFSERDIRLMEIITGRIASELERSALIRELKQEKETKKTA